MRLMSTNILIGLALAWLLMVLSPARGALFSPPQDNGELQTPIDTMKNDLAAGRLANAASRLDSLLNSHGDELISSGDTGLISVATFLQKLGMDDQTGLRAAYAKQFDSAAQTALQAAENSGHPSAGAL